MTLLQSNMYTHGYHAFQLQRS